MLSSRLDYGNLSPIVRTGLSRGPRRSARHVERFSEAGVEPRLEELLNDPLTAAIMRRDGVELSHLQTLIVETRQMLRHRAASV